MFHFSSALLSSDWGHCPGRSSCSSCRSLSACGSSNGPDLSIVCVGVVCSIRVIGIGIDSIGVVGVVRIVVGFVVVVVVASIVASIRGFAVASIIASIEVLEGFLD